MIRRLLVISDTHGNTRRLGTVLSQHADIKTVLFLGDGINDFAHLPEIRGRDVYFVGGNCDYGNSLVPSSRLEEFCGKKIFMCHGHGYHVKWDIEPLIEAANARGADIALYGHTHEPECTFVNGLYVINPGSLGHPHGIKPSYAIIDVTEKDILPNIIYMKA